MQLNRFDLNLLIALDALLQEKNVTRAAERLYLSQPAMSAALQKLRDYFNDPLLVRTGREMDLTPRAVSLIEPVRAALLRIQATLGTQASFDVATVSRSFTVVVTDHVVPRVMPRVLAQIMHEAPGVTCSVEELTHTSLSRLEYGDVDMCLLIDNPRVFGLHDYPETLRTADLAPLRWVCAVWKDHPTIGEELTEEQFISTPHLIGRPPGNKTQALEMVRHLSKKSLDVRVSIAGFMELPFMLVGTPLIAIMPEAVAKQFAGFLPIKFFAPPHPVADSREILVWHKRNESDAGHAWLRSLFLTAARQL
jgi:LysR family nod box-dependent transcriptional activator